MNRFRSRRAATPGEAKESETSRPVLESSADAPYGDVRRSQVESSVAAALRWARTGGPAWRLGRHSVYRLPWYVVVGERGAGKSTMLRASGMRPGRREDDALDPAGRSPPRWWFGDDAVLFETTIGDATDNAHWPLLLRRLKRVRSHCPINGIVVVVSASRIADKEAGDACRSEAVRARIADAYKVFKRRVPVYVLVTHGDRLPGFEAFVGDVTDAACATPMGVTFPLKGKPFGRARAEGFAQALNAWVRGAKDHLVLRLPVRADSRRAAMTYRFPSALSDWVDALGRFVCDAFDATPEHPEPGLLRAVCVSAVSNVDVGSCAGASSNGADARAAAGPMRFGARFLPDVVFGERDLVRSYHALPRRFAVVRGIAAASTVALAACLSVGLVMAYCRGSAAVAATAPSASALVSAARQGVDVGSPRAILRLLDLAHGLPCGHAWQASSGSWLAGVELVRELHLERACQGAYRTVLRETLQSYVVARMTDTLADAHVAASTQYATLRAYLMLGDRAHYDRAAVLAWIAREAANTGLSAAEQAAWMAHAAAWADPVAFTSNVRLDASLVAHVRARLLAQSAAQRVFATVLPELEAAMPDPLSVAEMAGPAAALAFYRKTARPLSEGVPGAFTLAGMRRYFGLRDAALARARSETWVLGPAGTLQMRALPEELDRLYFTRYSAAWDAIIGDVGLRPLSSAGDGAAMVQLLTGRDSPLRAYLMRAAKETTLASAASPQQASQPAPAGLAARVGRTLRRWLSGAPSTTLDRREPDREPSAQAQLLVDRHFDALHLLLHPAGPDANGNSGSPLDQALAQLKEVAVYLKASALARKSGLLPPPDDALTRLADHAATLPAPLGNMLQGLAQDGAASAQAEERAEIDERWRADVAAFCHAAIDGRYPFVADASTDVTLDDFTRLFAPGGLLDTFFQANLKAYVDTTTSPWTWRASIAPAGLSSTALDEFERAARIRAVFFPAQGKAIDVRFTLAPRHIDPEIKQFTFASDGQKITYAEGAPPIAAFQWPDRTAQASARVDYRLAGDDSTLSIEARGAWSLFRLLDRGQLVADSADRVELTYSLGTRSIELELAASSVVNPFGASGWRAFRCPSGI